MSALLSLAARCEAATGPDRSLDGDIEIALGRLHPLDFIHPSSSVPPAREFTGDVGKAISLLPTDGTMNMLDVNFTWEPADGAIWPAASVRWYPPHKSGPDWHALTVTAKTLPLTICAAALRARAIPERND